jgi:hypothetical protein
MTSIAPGYSFTGIAVCSVLSVAVTRTVRTSRTIRIFHEGPKNER